jgi:CubicO group peptidase (beta-lactamase class C family)
MKKYIVFSIVLFSICTNCCKAQHSHQDSLLDVMTSLIEKNSYTDIHSVLIYKGNKQIYEHYFNGFGMDSLQDSRSSFKSITSLLVGIAIDKRLIKNVNQKVYAFFPEYKQFENYDDKKKEMTIKNLLEMESGFDCEEFNDTKDCEGTMTTTNDWVKFSLDLPMKYSPGKVWSYTSSDPMIISGIISNVSKMSIMDFAKKYLFEPLGITKYRWTIDPAGHGMTAGSFYILPADMMKIGLLVKNKGIWEGKRIVSEKWVNESTNTPIAIPDFSFVKFSKSDVAIPQPTYYGYYWYTEEVKTKSYNENVLFASGNGGQYIMIIKNLELVVVFTQGNYSSWKAKRAFDILAKYILPSYKPVNK